MPREPFSTTNPQQQFCNLATADAKDISRVHCWATRCLYCLGALYTFHSIVALLSAQDLSPDPISLTVYLANTVIISGLVVFVGRGIRSARRFRSAALLLGYLSVQALVVAIVLAIEEHSVARVVAITEILYVFSLAGSIALVVAAWRRT